MSLDMPESINRMYAAFRRGDYSTALNIGTHMSKERPTDFDAVYIVASIKSLPLPEFNDYPGAMALMAESVNASPNDERRWLALAEVQTSSGEYGAAAATYRKTLEFWPSSYEALVNLAILRKMPGVSMSEEQSLALLERAVAADSERGEAFYYLGQQKKVAGQIADARQLLTRAVQLFAGGNPALRAAAERELRSLQP